IRAEISGIRIGDMHRTAFAFAVTGSLAEKLREHAIQSGSLGDTVSVTSMRARDVVIGSERLTDTHSHRFFPYIKVGEARHQRSGVEIVSGLFEQPNHDHTTIHVKPLLSDVRLSFRWIQCSRHYETPERRSKTL